MSQLSSSRSLNYPGLTAMAFGLSSEDTAAMLDCLDIRSTSRPPLASGDHPTLQCATVGGSPFQVVDYGEAAPPASKAPGIVAVLFIAHIADCALQFPAAAAPPSASYLQSLVGRFKTVVQSPALAGVPVILVFRGVNVFAATLADVPLEQLESRVPGFALRSDSFGPTEQVALDFVVEQFTAARPHDAASMYVHLLSSEDIHGEALKSVQVAVQDILG